MAGVRRHGVAAWGGLALALATLEAASAAGPAIEPPLDLLEPSWDSESALGDIAPASGPEAPREDAAAPAPVPEPEGPHGPPPAPPKAVPDAAWAALLDGIEGRPPNGQELAFIERRANQDHDPVALELLGFAHARGWGAPTDYELAYEYYGRAFLAGVAWVKPNLDALWSFLDPEAQVRLKLRFDGPGG